MPTMSKDMDEQFKLAHKIFDIVDRANRKVCNSAAVQCGQTRGFSSPIVCKKEGGREVSTKRLCELYT